MAQEPASLTAAGVGALAGVIAAALAGYVVAERVTTWMSSVMSPSQTGSSTD